MKAVLLMNHGGLAVPFEVAQPSSSALMRLAGDSDVIVTVKFPLKLLPAAQHARIVVDMYAPFYTEMLELSRGYTSTRHRTAWLEPRRKNALVQLAIADLVLCANTRQRDLFAGIMGTLGLVRADTYDQDTNLGNVIRVAPYGLRRADATRREPGIKGVIPGVTANDIVLLWNGTIIEWYDAELLIRAVHRVSQQHPHVKLVFLGTNHPHNLGADPLQGMGGGAVASAIRLCEELGILDRQVFFNFGWADDVTTERFLLDADIGVATYFDNLETRYAFRVRLLDLIWAGLPIIATHGDVISEMVDERGLGITVPERDLNALTDAIRRLVEEPELRALCRSRLEAMRPELSWERMLEPLVEFCRAPDAWPMRRKERALAAGRLALDWLVSEAHLSVRYDLAARLRSRVKAGSH